MKIKLATINLDVADPQASKRFYVDALGLTENVERSHPPSFVYLSSEGADVTLARPESNTRAEPSRTMELGFEVGDIAEARARLERHGARVSAKAMGWGDVVETRDLDGHRVIVYAFRRE